MQRGRTIGLAVGTAVLPVVAFGWLVTARVRQAELDRALVAAIQRDDGAAALSLLQRGADPNAPEHPAPPPSALAAIIRSIFQASRDSSRLQTHALGLAVQNEQDAVALELLRRGADPNTPIDERGPMTPLMVVSGSDMPTVFNALIARGANVNAPSVNGYTALMGAAMGGSAANVRSLLRAGADVRQQDNSGQTALHYAVYCAAGAMSEQDSIAVASLLIGAGANVNARDSSGATPLNFATAAGNRRLAAFLARHCAGPRRPDAKQPLALLERRANRDRRAGD